MSGTRRVACYVDGFNLYHAIADLKQPALKWLDLSELARSLCRPNEHLVKTSYFSAFATWMPNPYRRHREYVRALQAVGVNCYMARFAEKSVRCRSCGCRWTQHEEKETDVHFSLAFVEDAFDDVFDRAVIVSADSDHAPAVRRVRSRYPAKEVFCATPLKRYKFARGLRAECNSGIEITRGRLSGCLLPKVVCDAAGKVRASRPSAYD